MSEVVKESNQTVVKPQQNIVASMSRVFREELLGLIREKDTEDLVVDLEGVEMVDSDGLSVLIAAHRQLDKNGKKLIVQGASKEIRAFFRIMRLDSQFILKN